MPLIAKNFVSERLLPAVEIEKLIGSYLKLTRHGSSYTCCCPFHHEKTPSFSVTPSKNMFYCYGCHTGGDALTFIMKYKNLGFVDAVEELAAFAGIPVEYEASGRKDPSDRFKIMYELMDRCAAAFTQALFSDEGKAGLEYFTQKRGLTKETMLKARLGFAPDGWHFIEEKVCKNEQEIRLLTELGLIVGNNGRRFSMYRNRVMIPIFDRKGRIISFGGRTMGDDKPKYMNTKETPIYKKRNELFGLYEALRDNNNRPSRLVIVEGYMDVISVRQAGFSCAVASLGTATTQEQFKLMFRYTKKLICCYDGDSAGRAAAWHALETVTPVLSEDTEVSFVFLPAEDDPDSLVRSKGLGAFLKYLDDAQSYPEFLISHVASLFNLQDPNSRAAYFAEAMKLIRRVQVNALSEVCVEEFAKKSGISSDRAWSMLESQKNHETDFPFQKTFETKNTNTDTLLSTPIRVLMAFALQFPAVIALVYEPFGLAEFLQLCRRLNIRGADLADELISSIAGVNESKTADLTKPERTEKISTAVLLARVEDPKLHECYEKLALADLGKECSERQGCLNHRIIYLARLLPQVLAKPLLSRIAFLQTNLDMGGGDSAMQELTELTRGLEKRGLNRKI